MLSDKTKRNIWLTLAITSILAVINRTIKLAAGETEWWSLASAIVILAYCTKFYLCYRRKVRG